MKTVNNNLDVVYEKLLVYILFDGVLSYHICDSTWDANPTFCTASITRPCSWATLPDTVAPVTVDNQEISDDIAIQIVKHFFLFVQGHGRSDIIIIFLSCTH
jgi:hypothetical protein